MLLPARGFHDGRYRCALRPSQHAKDDFLFGAATRWARNTLKRCRSFGASLAAYRLGFTAFFAVQHLISLRLRWHKRRHRRSPAVATGPAGRDPDRAEGPISWPTLTLCLQRQSSPFWRAKLYSADDFERGTIRSVRISLAPPTPFPKPFSCALELQAKGIIGGLFAASISAPQYLLGRPKTFSRGTFSSDLCTFGQ